MKKPIMFVTPQRGVKYPYVIYNMAYLIRYKNEIKRIIGHDPKIVLIDSGINHFFEIKKLKEYPDNFLKNYFRHAERISRKIHNKLENTKIWISIPDYPADMPDNELENNVERTIDNWLRFKEMKSDHFDWLPVIQVDEKTLKALCIP